MKPLPSVITSILCLCCPVVRAAERDEKPAPDATASNLSPLVVEASANQTTPYGPPAATSVTGLPAPIKELPLTVSTVNDEFIDDTSALRLRDLVGYVPGVNASEDSGGTGDLLNIRGFDFIYQTFVNGMRNRTGYNASRELENIERIEIFKGPGGVEFGVGDPGGFVNFVTKKPLFIQSAEIGAEVGSYDLIRAYVDATGPLQTSGTSAGRTPLGVFYRMIVEADSANSFRDTFNTDGVLVAPSVLWNYAEDSSLLFEFEYQYRDQPYDRGTIYLEGAGFHDNFAPVERSFHEPDDYADVQNTRSSLYWTHKLNESITLRASGEINTSNTVGKAVRSPFTFLLYKPGTNEWNGDPTILRTTQRLDSDNWSAGIKPEVLLNFETGPVKHTGLLGFDYLFTNIHTKSKDGFDSRPIDLFDPVYDQDPVILPSADPSDPASIPAGARDFRFEQELQEFGLYYQHKADISNRFHLLGGLRYDWYEDKFAVTRNVQAVPLGSLRGYHDRNLSARLGGVYDVNRTVSVFAGASDSFQPQQGLLASGENAEALEATSFEGGVKASFLNDRLQTTLSLYQTDRENLLEDDPGDPTDTFVKPLGDVRVRGLELEASGSVTPELEIQGGFAFMDSEITDTQDATTRGNEFYNVPNFQAGLRVRYDTSKWLLPGLGVGGGVVYVGEREGDATNSFELPDYIRFDAGLYYEWRNWNFKFTCENLFNERYYLASQGFADIIQPGSPRFFTLGASVKF